jgi:hypothetical protein
MQHIVATSVDTSIFAVKRCASSNRSPDLLVQARGALRRNHSSRRTEEASIGWARRFVRLHHVRHPREMGSVEIGAFLTVGG